MDEKNNSIVSNPKGVCEKLFTVFRATSPFRIIRLSSHQHREDAAKPTSMSPQGSLLTPSWLSNPFARESSDKKQQCRTATTDRRCSDSNPKPKTINNSTHNTITDKQPIDLPILGQENRVPPMVEHGHVVSASSTNVNGMFNEFIDRTMQKFHTTPANDGMLKSGANNKQEFGTKDSKIQYSQHRS